MAGDRLVWIDPSGVEQDLLDQPDVFVQWGVLGRDMPRFSHEEEEVVGEHGARLLAVRVKPREIELPLFITAETDSEFRDRLDEFTNLFNPTRGEGTLRSIRNGRAREVYCRYKEGMEGQEDLEQGGSNGRRAMVVFRAHDPYWYDRDTTDLTFTADAPAFFPFFPMTLSAGDTFSEININNDGHVDAWPIWTIRGPMDTLKITNETSGLFIDLGEIELGSEDIVTIDTRPGEKIAKKNDEPFRKLKPGSRLFPIDKGHNSIRVEATETTSNSLIVASYRRRWNND